MAAQCELDFIQDARNTAEMLLQAADLLERAWCSGAVEDEAPEEEEIPQPTFEELRGFLADKARVGFREQIKDILTGYGAERLSSLPENLYGRVKQQVEEISNASR